MALVYATLPYLDELINKSHVITYEMCVGHKANYCEMWHGELRDTCSRAQEYV
jgi:hypothetical protein